MEYVLNQPQNDLREDVLNQGLLLSNDYSLYPFDVNITSTDTISELLQRADVFYGNNLTAVL